MDSEKIEKIKKLLALANNNSFEEEANSALQKAQEMMNSAGLSIEDIHNSSMEDEFGKLGENWLNNGEEKMFYNWKKILISSLAYFFDCEIINSSVGRKSKIKIIGREGNRLTCEIMYNWLHDNAMKEAKKLFGSQTAKRNSYCVGFALGIKEKVKNIKPSNKEKNAWGIIPVNEVQQWIIENYPTLRKTRITASSAVGSALNAGKEAGLNTSLNKQFGLKAIRGR